MTAISKGIKKTVREVVKVQMDSRLKGKVKEVEKRLGDKIQGMKHEFQPIASPFVKLKLSS